MRKSSGSIQWTGFAVSEPMQSLMQRELPRGRLTEIAQARFTTHHNLERR